MSSQSPYQTTMTAALDALGWSQMHVRPVFDSRAKRWLTPTTTKGWPDLSAVHHRTGAILYAELKGHHGLKTKAWTTADLRPEQIDWLHRLHRNPACACVVFRPDDDWVMVTRWLSDPSTLLSGYGWLPEYEWRGIILRNDPHIGEVLRARTDSALSLFHHPPPPR